MGAWGHGPLDNDPAADLFDSVIDKVKKIAYKKRMVDDDYEEVRAAAVILMRLDPERNCRQEAALLWDKIKVIKADAEWIENWKEPGAVRASIADQLVALGAAYGLK